MKRKSFLLAILSIACMAFASWTGGASEPSIVKIDGHDFYSITSPEELAWFSDQVKSGKTTINARLENDIVLNDSGSANKISWRPIGDTLKRAFNGIFEGNGNSISGLYYRKAIPSERYERFLDSTYTGLFGVVGEQGIVRNVTVNNAQISASSSGDESASRNYSKTGMAYGGGIVGYNKGYVENVSFSGNISASASGVTFTTSTSKSKGFSYVGGIAGYNAGHIKNASVSGIISAWHSSETNTGETCGGGIVGYAAAGSSVKNSTNTAYVKGSSSETVVGGIVGKSEKILTIDSCINKGFVGDTTSNYNQYTASIKSVGGILGYSSDSLLTILNSTNYGTLYNHSSKSNAYVGGIVGYFNVTSSIARMKLDNVTNYGKVTAWSDSAAAYSSGIVAFFTTSLHTNGSFEILNTKNVGEVNATAGTNLGRATGIIYSNKHQHGRIHNCANTGSITAESGYTTRAAVLHAAGIIQNAKHDTITQTYNSARIFVKPISEADTRRTHYAAGIANGLDSSYMENVYNSGDVEVYTVTYYSQAIIGMLVTAAYGFSIKNVYTSGSSNYPSSYCKVLAITGFADISSAYYDKDDLESSGNGGAAIGLSKKALQTDSMAWILNTDGGKSANSGVWTRKGGYPVFADDENESIKRIAFVDEQKSLYRYTNNASLVSEIPEKATVLPGKKFSGWFVGEELIDSKYHFASEMEVVAKYEEFTETYPISFLNANGELLGSYDVMYGELPVYEGEVNMDPTAQYTFTFKGWKPEIQPVENEQIYIAEYDSTINSYNITFLNDNGSELETISELYGNMPKYEGTVEKEDYEAHSYTLKYAFSGWTPELKPVDGNATYKAKFDSTTWYKFYLDDFEDGDAMSFTGGFWDGINDNKSVDELGNHPKSTCQNSTVVNPSGDTTYNVIYPSNNGSAYMAALKGITLNKGSYSNNPYIHLNLTLQKNHSGLDISSCPEITYDYQGAAHRLQVLMQGDEKGAITQYNYHHKEIPATSKWTTVTIKKSDFKQESGWGKTVSLNWTKIMGFVWDVRTSSYNYLYVDNVRCTNMTKELILSSSSVKESSSSAVQSSSSVEATSSSSVIESCSSEIQSSSAVESSSSVASSSSRETVSSSSTEAPSSSSELESSSSAIPSSCSSAEVSSSSVKASSSSVSLSSSSAEVSSSSIALSSSSTEIQSSSAEESSSSVSLSSSSKEVSSSSSASSSSSSEIQSSSAEESSSSVSPSSSSEKVSSSSIEPSSSSETISSSSVEVSSSSVKVSSSSAELSSSSEMSSSSAAPSSSSVEATSSSSVMESSSSEENTPLITGISKTFTVSVVDHRILITNARIGSTFALFDMQGRTLSQGKINSGSHLIEVPKKGKYIIWANGTGVTVTIK